MKKSLLAVLFLLNSWSVAAGEFAMELESTYAMKAEHAEVVVEENKHETCGSQWNESERLEEASSSSGKEGNQGAETHEVQQQKKNSQIKSSDKPELINKKEDKAYILNV